MIHACYDCNVVGGTCLDAGQTVVLRAISDPNLSQVTTAVLSAGLLGAFTQEGIVNVFAPNNGAFEVALNNLGVSAQELFSETDLLKKLLANHIVVDGALCSGMLTGNVSTLLPGSTLNINGNVVTTDRGGTANIVDVLAATNGQIFVIDNVLFPILPDGFA